jgi:SAM-dependent methyltransferase
MGTNDELNSDPSNTKMVEAWDGKEGAFWTAEERRFNDVMVNCHGPFLAAAELTETDRVLDIGCGTGQTTRDAARIAAAGSAVGVDLSSQMLALARRIAADEGVTNAEFRHADAQIHPFDPATFDAAISRMGSMFFGDPIAAFTNIGRALRPGGRVTLLTWQGVESNEWFLECSAAMAAGRDLPVPSTDTPGPFAFSEPDRVRAILTAAGFVDVRFEDLTKPMRYGATTDDAFDFIVRFAGWMLDGLDESQRTAALASLRDTVARHSAADGVTYRCATWIIGARKP